VCARAHARADADAGFRALARLLRDTANLPSLRTLTVTQEHKALKRALARRPGIQVRFVGTQRSLDVADGAKRAVDADDSDDELSPDARPAKLRQTV
jgi:hypothetical protein